MIFLQKPRVVKDVEVKWENGIFDLRNLQFTTTNNISFAGDQAKYGLIEIIQSIIQEERQQGYDQGRLRCLQHHYPKELENARQQERERVREMVKEALPYHLVGDEAGDIVFKVAEVLEKLK